MQGHKIKSPSKNWFVTTNLHEFTMAMYRGQFVAVSRCSILTPAGPTKGQLCEA